MTPFRDGPASPLFSPLPLGLPVPAELPDSCPAAMRAAWKHAPRGASVSRGLPFDLGALVAVPGTPVTLQCAPTTTQWLVFAHVADVAVEPRNEGGFTPHARGGVVQGRHEATYTLFYADGVEAAVVIRRGREIGHYRPDVFATRPTEALGHTSFRPERVWPDDKAELSAYTYARTNGAHWDPQRPYGPWITWLFAVANPHPGRSLVGLRLVAEGGVIVLQGVCAGRCSDNPLRWRERRKCLLPVSDGQLSAIGAIPGEHDTSVVPAEAWAQLRALNAIAIDLGEIASFTPVPDYPAGAWDGSTPIALPAVRTDCVLAEYSCHAEARFHFPDGRVIEVAAFESAAGAGGIQAVTPAHQRVRLRIVDRHTHQPVAARVHFHGMAGEYLAPEDRHRRPILAWLIDDGIDYVQGNVQLHTYVDGETRIRLPLGTVHYAVSKGFETRPVRGRAEITPGTEELFIELERTLDWRRRGWVTADTHVHTLAPQSALLQGAAEGVNLVNLLASQWGELLTNAGDFDGHTTLARHEAGSGDDFLVRVGTENRQQNLGHISLLAYHDRMILPLCTGGPDESALGDPVEVLLTEWAEQCRAQGGIVVMPHFPGPRCESAAVIVEGLADAVEMCSIGREARGIDPYSLSDWYRYLNCGYCAAAVGGTDKMAAFTPVGLIRTYARLRDGEPFTLEAWKAAVRRAETFVSYGPLLEFSVEGHPPGAALALARDGATLGVAWEVATLLDPMTHVELVRNGEVIESRSVTADLDAGHWSVRMRTSGWLALLVRGRNPAGQEIILAHSSPVMVHVEGSAMLPAADALTILEQIEGAIGFLDALATRAEEKVHKRMRLRLTAAHRALHNRLHAAGLDHVHATPQRHDGHE